MTLRRVAFITASIGLGLGLLVVLIRIGKIDLSLTLQHLRSVRGLTFAKLVLLNAVLIFISTEKWRRVDAALRHPTDEIPSKSVAFGVTSAGMALGLVLPVQIGMSTARTLGTYFYGRPFRRGTAGSLFEQSFDLLIVCVLGMASGLTLLYGGGAVIWCVCAFLFTGLAILAAAPCMQFIRWMTRKVAGKLSETDRLGAELRQLAVLEETGLLGSRLARQLISLSAIRFVVMVFMTAQTAEAVNSHVALWKWAAMTPFVAFANVLAITPGGVGVNEATSVSILRLLGIPLAVSTEWSLVNRVLVTASSFIVALSSLAILGLQRLSGRMDAKYKRGTSNAR
jgi:uncharacterized membrane protein YbhN (UPF0104 family)